MFKNIKPLNLKSIPVLAKLCGLAKIKETINNMVEWKKTNTKTSPGFLIETLVIAILAGRKPLWKLNEFWAEHDIQTIYNDPNITAEKLNDDAYARALDKLSTVKMEELVSKISLNMLKEHNQNIETIHLDTTSKSVQGIYEKEIKGEFEITYGHSKDHRPDLKQFKIGAAVNQSKLPVMGQLLSGNTADSKWNTEAIVKMKSYLEKQGYKDIIFIGDTATVSSYENIKKLKGIKFISRLPETFALAKELKQRAITEDKWENIGIISNNKKAAEYKIKSYIQTIEGIHYRFIVVHSSQLENKKKHTIEKKITKEKEKLTKEAKTLSKHKFACYKDAKIAEEKFINKIKTQHFQYESKIIENKTIKYGKKGRPSKDNKGKEIIEYQVNIEIKEYDNKAYREKLLCESCFVLITSILKKTEYSDVEILKEYKNQSSIETAFRFLKSPVYLGPVYLKKAKRVEALGYVFILVLLIASYLEYRVRKTIKENNEYLLEPNGKKNTKPSVRTILEVLDFVPVLIIDGKRFFPSNINPKVLKMIEWTGFNTDIYLYSL